MQIAKTPIWSNNFSNIMTLKYIFFFKYSFQKDEIYYKLMELNLNKKRVVVRNCFLFFYSLKCIIDKSVTIPHLAQPGLTKLKYHVFKKQRKLHTILKTPMANKTWSKEQFNIRFFLLKVDVKFFNNELVSFEECYFAIKAYYKVSLGFLSNLFLLKNSVIFYRHFFEVVSFLPEK